MNDQHALPPATPPAPERDRTGLLITCATIVILAALGGGGYLLKQELDRLANAKPEAPAEVTSALSDLRTQLEQQRSDNAAQLQTLQNELAALKEQQAAQTPPDMNAAIAPVQEKLDAIVAQLQEAPPSPPATESAELPAESLDLNPTPIAPEGAAVRDYLALRRAVEAGRPYARELAVLIPQLPASEVPSITTLQQHAEQGLGEDDEEMDAPEAEIKPWMAQLNDKLRGLVSIKPSATPRAEPQARAAAIAALDHIEASLMGGE